MFNSSSKLNWYTISSEDHWLDNSIIKGWTILLEWLVISSNEETSWFWSKLGLDLIQVNMILKVGFGSVRNRTKLESRNLTHFAIESNLS